MALTNEDLSAISQLLDTKLDSKFKEELQPVKEEISGIKDEMQGMKTELQGVKDDMQGMKAEIQGTKDEVKGIKDEMRDMRADMQDMKGRIIVLEWHQENVTDKNIALLIENCIPAAKAYMESTKQIKSMQEDIDVMKEVIKEHSKILSRGCKKSCVY